MTVPGIGPGHWDADKLTRSQMVPLESPRATLYRLYTEDRPNLEWLISRYFEGASIYSVRGLWQGVTEHGAVIEILGNPRDRQHIFDLAGDIRVVNGQSSVLVTWQTVGRFDITAQAISEAQSAL